MADTVKATKASGTAWGAVLGGWVATIGASVILAPFAAGPLLATDPARRGTDTSALPVVLGVLLAYVVGGYVGGRMAGYRTSWHGLMTAFVGLFMALLGALLAGAADRGAFAAYGVNTLRDVLPNVDFERVDRYGDVLVFGAMLSFLAAIIGGWLGGVLAPAQAALKGGERTDGERAGSRDADGTHAGREAGRSST